MEYDCCRAMRCWVLAAGFCIGLSACSSDFSFFDSGSLPVFASDRIAPSEFHAPVSVEQGLPMENFLPPPEKEQLQKQRLGLSFEESASLGCGLRDRFDRKAAAAYNFSGGQDRLSLHMSIDGPSLSSPAQFEVNSMMIRFTHKLQKPPKGGGTAKSKCLFPSPFQGVAGSVYNEFFVRDNFTIWDDLSVRGIDLK